MKNGRIDDGRLCAVTGQELLVRGGTTWHDVQRIIYYVKVVIDFIADYKDDIYRGLERGWRIL